MITSAEAYRKLGDPTKESSMVVLDLSQYGINIPHVPQKVYCNKLLVQPLTSALKNVIVRELKDQIKTWDGCFNIRKKRGATSMSLHSWGLAVDINAPWNRYGYPPTMPKELVKCFTDAGFDWGGTWSKPDGMHMQLAKWPS